MINTIEFYESLGAELREAVDAENDDHAALVSQRLNIAVSKETKHVDKVEARMAYRRGYVQSRLERSIK